MGAHVDEGDMSARTSDVLPACSTASHKLTHEHARQQAVTQRMCEKKEWIILKNKFDNRDT